MSNLLKKIYEKLLVPPKWNLTPEDDPFRKEMGVCLKPKLLHNVEQYYETLKLQNNRILKSVFVYYRRWIILLFIPEIFKFIFRSIRPYVVYRMLSAFQKQAHESDFTEIIIFTMLNLCNELILAIVEEKSWFAIHTLSSEIESVLNYVVNRKSLKIYDLKSSKENVISLLSQDCNNVASPFFQLYRVPSDMLRFIMSFIYLFFLLKYASLVTVVVLLILLPINYFAIRRSFKIHLKRKKITDKRIDLMNECINNIRFIKSFFWEGLYEKRLNDYRREEIKERKFAAAIWQIVEMVWFTASFFLSSFSFIVFNLIERYYYQSDTSVAFNAGIIFTAMTIIRSIVHPIFSFANSINDYGKTKTSLKRLEDFLNLPNVDVVSKEVMEDSIAVRFDNCDFNWNTDKEEEKEKIKNTSLLKDLTFEIKKGEFIAIIGKVGSGKTSFASALLGEMVHKKGEISFNDIQNTVMTYCPQDHWILSSSIRENVLLGDRYDPEPYRRIIKRCGLDTDIAEFPKKDRTVVGEKGVMISGGQKARSKLLFSTCFTKVIVTQLLVRKDCYFTKSQIDIVARVCYQNYINEEKDDNNQISIFDDSLKDLDVRVSNHVFNKIFLKELKNQTRILITHNLQFLSSVDRIFILEDGKIVEQGTYAQLERRIKEWKDEDFVVEKNEDAKEKSQYLTVLKAEGTPMTPYKTPLDSNSLTGSAADFLSPQNAHIQDGFNIKALWKNFLSVYPKTFYVFIILLIIRCVVEKYRDYFLSTWTKDSGYEHHGLTYYIVLYMIIGIFISFIVYISQFIFSHYVLSIANILHDRLLNKVMGATIRFFDKTSSGSILSRFSRDLETIDGGIRWQLREIFFVGGRLVSTLLFTYYFVPLYSIVSIPFFLTIIFIGRQYMKRFVEVARFTSRHSISPLISHCNESLSGLASIRGFRKKKFFIHQNFKKIETREIGREAEFGTNEWICYRGRIIQLWNIFGFCFFNIFYRSLDRIYVAMIFSLLFEVDFDLTWVTMLIPRLQKSICSLERIAKYEEVLEQENYEGEMGAEFEKTFPERGVIEFRKVSFKYDKEFVLKSITFRVQAGEKIGVVGRTGRLVLAYFKLIHPFSGKSTLVKLIFRLYALEKRKEGDDNSFDGGEILIDDTNIFLLSLDCLRNCIVYIAQNPTLISGRIRDNLDVRSEFEDSVIWEALEKVGLKEKVQDLKDRLETDVGEIKFSAGEKQLICFARALLYKKKIVILDEASSACDLETDEKIQYTINRYFNDCTIIAIAHRLETIMSYDKILVLEKGSILQYGSPKSLLDEKESLLLQMVNETGEKRAKELKKMAGLGIENLDLDEDESEGEDESIFVN